MNKHLKFALFLMVYWAGIISILAQDDQVNYTFKKGEVLDVLLLTNGPDAKTLFPRYRKTAFPIASKFSFQPVPGLPISETLQGGVQPKSIIFGKWDSREKREQFLEAIVPAVPDFHEQRRAIWTYFTLTYYEMDKDVTFAVDRSKYNVVTSFWGDGKAFQDFIAGVLLAQKQQGGKQIITLTNGTSPAGYVYNPDYLTITQWESKAAFEKFNKTHQYFSEKQISNVHQFALK